MSDIYIKDDLVADHYTAEQKKYLLNLEQQHAEVLASNLDLMLRLIEQQKERKNDLLAASTGLDISGLNSISIFKKQAS